MRGDRSNVAERRMTLLGLYAMVASVVLLQRLALPPSQVALSLLFVIGGFLFLLLSGALVEDRVRMGLYLVAMTLCLAAAVGSFVLTEGASFFSLLLLAVLYAPFTYVLRPPLLDLYPKILEFFCKLMVIGALLAIGQWVAQVSGAWTYSDLMQMLPQQFLLQDYNTTYPVYYGSPIMKSNGVIFLEPSFCSQFLALAIIAQLATGGKRWRIPVYVGGILATISGTGLLLLAFGLTVLAWRRGALWSFGVLAATLVAIAAVAVTPAGKLFAERAQEARESQSSVSLRFTDPFERAFRDIGRGWSAPFVGHGPGFVEREATVYQERTDLALAFPPVPKLATEYGVFAALAFTAFMIAAFWSRTPEKTIAASLVFMHLTLSGSLLQPPTVYLALLLASLFATIVPLRRFDPVPVPAFAAQRATT
jgi:hypothetical protein